MHGFKRAILTIFQFFQKLEVASFLPSKFIERHCEMIQINMFSFLFFSEKWWTSLAKFYMRRPLPWSHWTSQGNPTVPGGQLGPFWTSGGSVRLQEISCAKWLSISHLNGMTHNWAEWQNPQKVRFKNSWNWLGHSYAYNILTNFQYETRACNDRKRKLSISDKTRESLRSFWTNGRSVRLQEISCAKWLSISHLNGMTPSPDPR